MPEGRGAANWVQGRCGAGRRGPTTTSRIRLAAWRQQSVLFRLPAAWQSRLLLGRSWGETEGSLLALPAGEGVLWRVQHPGARQGRGDEGVAEGAGLHSSQGGRPGACTECCGGSGELSADSTPSRTHPGSNSSCATV